ncbi:MAG: hypothetical protein ACK4KW_02245 [Gemmobacter sp.]
MRRRMMLTGLAGLTIAGAALAGTLGWRRYRRGPALPPVAAPLSDQGLAARYAQPLTPPQGPLRVFHLGHSLVARDMPAMLEQLAPSGHRHESQLGWGTPLRAHWEPRVEIAGFDTENAHPRFRPAREALASGDYDAVVLTEMVEIRDAIRWHASPAYLARWTRAAREGRADVRVYLYETWHRLDDPEGWLTRIDADLPRYWQGELLARALAEVSGPPVWLIPAGQALAAVVRAAEAGGVPGLTDRRQLFALDGAGAVDTIHLNDLGNYLVALVHLAVLYHRSPEGLPHALRRADGSPAEALVPEGAAAMQRIVRNVVRANALTGLAPEDAS